MKALITGASSGIGKDMAYYLASLKIDLILVARREDRLEEIKRNVDVEVKIIDMDLGKLDNLYKLYDKVKDDDIDILINNAGFGLFGNFIKTDLMRELEMIDVNVRAYHVLTKLFLKDFVKKNKGYILNVASSAGFMAGPNLSTYYATKNYVVRLSEAIYEEIRRDKKNVGISILCPGPVSTEFNFVAKGNFTISALNSEDVARMAIDAMFRRKLIIVPGFMMKLGLFFRRFVSEKMLLQIAYGIQKKKEK